VRYDAPTQPTGAVDPGLDPSDSKQLAAAAAVELEASRRDPYRQLSRIFHLVGRKRPS